GLADEGRPGGYCVAPQEGLGGRGGGKRVPRRTPGRAEKLEPEDDRPAAAPVSPEAGYRFKAFAGDLGRVESALARLESSGFYWAALSGAEAKGRLSGQPVGTFLLRDSADPRHLFTLSVRTVEGITNLRVRQRRAPGTGGAFYLETEGGGPATPAAAYDCVVKLADHYVRLSGAGPAFYRGCGGGRGQGAAPLLLRQPLLCKVPALQDLCRRALNLQPAGGQLDTLALPSGLRHAIGN
ncbi:suppressor of cytokine signaling 3-like, partial [Mustelus asterias]